MPPQKILELLVFLTREVARLHGLTSSLREVIEEQRILDPRLDVVDAAQKEIDALQRFLEKVEEIDPELAALVDDRGPRGFDTSADPDSRFPE